MTRTAGRERSILAALFWVPLALAAVWIVAWPPHSVDGPAHLLGARAIADHSDATYGAYYEIDWFPTPNLAGTRLLALAVSLGGLRFAGTMMMLLAALGTPLALRYALRAVRPESAWLAITGLPLAFGYLYFYGFWNYCLAIALALVCVGLALRVAPSWSPRPTAALAVLLTLTWLTHLVPFVAAVLFLCAVVVTGPRTRRSWLAPAATVLPGAALSLAYLLRTDSGDGPTWTNPIGRALGLVSLHTTITTYSRWEDVIAVVIAAVLVAVALRAHRAVPATDTGSAGRAAGLAAAAAAVLVLITPTNFGIDFGLIDERLAVFPVLFGLLWLAARPPEPRVAIAAATALAVATGALAVVRVSDLQDYDDLAEEYLSAGKYIDEGSVLVALRFATLGPDAGRNSSWDPTRHLSSELAAERYSIDVGHYEAVLDYFPARFREPNLRRAIDATLTGLGQVPPEARLPVRCEPGTEFSVGPTARRLAGLDFMVPSEEYIAAHPIRYVLVIAPPDAAGMWEGELAETRATLSCAYDRIGATSPRGLVEVWRVRG
ncbi:hypothetical protein [Sporichthya sp.]|uniref:hypothetical protein n=1 Tax=Sporichthya sp. TaxID=65475 RepID=UPI0018249609|nr:hypothetical protein [Sporichthya sp.]MBA3744718.1 hypothetical protein [Sporichthya sp.]